MVKVVSCFISLIGCYSPVFSSIKAEVLQIDTSKKASIQIHLANASKTPLINEEILIESDNHFKKYRVVTNNLGNALVEVIAGYNYIIQLKTIGDTTTYGNLEIPAIKSNQNYTSPFTVDMVYEPARVYTFHHLEFDVAKAIIKNESYKELEQLAEYLQRKADVNIEIAGHTDNVGKPEDNLKLSMLRADAVKKYLVQKGIKPIRLIAKGYGANQPLADNTTEEGKQKNRRTEVRIL